MIDAFRVEEGGENQEDLWCGDGQGNHRHRYGRSRDIEANDVGCEQDWYIRAVSGEDDVVSAYSGAMVVIVLSRCRRNRVERGFSGGSLDRDTAKAGSDTSTSPEERGTSMLIREGFTVLLRLA